MPPEGSRPPPVLAQRVSRRKGGLDALVFISKFGAAFPTENNWGFGVAFMNAAEIHRAVATHFET